MVFLHKDGDFVPYTPRKKENLHENLHGLEREETVEHLELKIRNEVSKHALKASQIHFLAHCLWHFNPQLHDFAKLNDNVFYIYNDIEFFNDEPQKISIMCEEDILVTEEVYKRPMFTMPAYRLFALVSSHFSSDGAACGPSVAEHAERVINSVGCFHRG